MCMYLYLFIFQMQATLKNMELADKSSVVYLTTLWIAGLYIEW
jgi:hypothetical protein